MIQAYPVAGALGAEIQGVDLTSKVSHEIYKEIRCLLLKHKVIFFRNQKISPDQHIALARSLGPLQKHPVYCSLPDFPEIAILQSTAEKPTKIEAWHADMTFKLHPPMGAVLRAKVVPDRGGDTLWSNMVAAYQGLSDPMQRLLSELEAVHDFSWGFKESLKEPDGAKNLAQAVLQNPPVTHPVIRTHPETGEKLIFVNALFTIHIKGISTQESQCLLDFLFEHIRQPEWTCRFRWQPHSIAIWDNRSTQHKPINDYFPAHRLLERIVIEGDRPF